MKRAMPEQFHVAAVRHLKVGETLHKNGHLDDAGYHFGVSGECALKYGILEAGLHVPKKHFPSLAAAAKDIVSKVSACGTGRTSAAIFEVVNDPTFSQRFRGWSIDIRYAVSSCTPVQQADCDRWCKDASELVARLVIG